MKKIFTIFVLFFCLVTLQAQSGFSYQGVLRNGGKLRTNETLNLTANLIKGEQTVYSETHQAITNNYGVFSIIIGQGVPKPNNVYSTSIFFSNDPISLNTIRLEVKEGNTVITNTEILGVPFAEVAKVALKAQIDFPAGTIVAFGGDTTEIPEGWLFCNGKLLKKTLYPELHDAIKMSWGGDGDNFRVPDLRGVFLRGVNHGAKDAYKDPDIADTLRLRRYPNGNIGNRVGSYQADTLAGHKHNIAQLYGFLIDDGAGSSKHSWGRDPQNVKKYVTEPTGGKETRPVNAYVNYIIKY